jgi:hypothetical protein
LLIVRASEIWKYKSGNIDLRANGLPIPVLPVFSCSFFNLLTYLELNLTSMKNKKINYKPNRSLETSADKLLKGQINSDFTYSTPELKASLRKLIREGLLLPEQLKFVNNLLNKKTYQDYEFPRIKRIYNSLEIPLPKLYNKKETRQIFNYTKSKSK